MPGTHMSGSCRGPHEPEPGPRALECVVAGGVGGLGGAPPEPNLDRVGAVPSGLPDAEAAGADLAHRAPVYDGRGGARCRDAADIDPEALAGHERAAVRPRVVANVIEPQAHGCPL